MKHSLSAKERLILDLLGDTERYGLELVDASGGALKRGTVYVTLARMEESGLVTSHHEDGPRPGGGMPRRLYRATPLAIELVALQRSFTEAISAHRQPRFSLQPIKVTR